MEHNEDELNEKHQRDLAYLAVFYAILESLKRHAVLDTFESLTKTIETTIEILQKNDKYLLTVEGLEEAKDRVNKYIKERDRLPSEEDFKRNFDKWSKESQNHKD